jgi:hypothetical protein
MQSGSPKEILQMVKQGPPNPRNIQPVQIKPESTNNEYNERLVNLAKDSIAEVTASELKEKMSKPEKSTIPEPEEDNSFVYDDYGNKIRNIHASRARRKKIEARCKAMDIAELLMQGYIEQRVPLKPGKLEVVFRSLSSADSMFVLSQLEKDKGSNLLIAYKIGRMNLALSLVSINGERYEEVKRGGKINEEAFNSKYEKICNLPEDTATDLVINYGWFCERVKELSVDDESIINF